MSNTLKILWWFYGTVFLTIFGHADDAVSKKLDPFLWDSSSFNEGGNTIIVEVNDQLTIECPVAESVAAAKYNSIYLVSKEQYDNCKIDKTSQHIITCNTPLLAKSITLNFVEFDPLGLFDFKSGNSYYFISVSEDTLASLNNTSGGNCLKKSTKLMVDVCCQQSLQQDQPTSAPCCPTHSPSSKPTLVQNSTTDQPAQVATKDTDSDKKQDTQAMFPPRSDESSSASTIVRALGVTLLLPALTALLVARA